MIWSGKGHGVTGNVKLYAGTVSLSLKKTITLLANFIFQDKSGMLSRGDKSGECLYYSLLFKVEK